MSDFVSLTPTYGNNEITEMRYRRSKIEGGTYFFTVNTYNRNRFLCVPENVKLIRQAFRQTMNRHTFVIDAIVLLPDHLHCIWTLPESDSDYSMRWMLIKNYFSRNCQSKYEGVGSKSRLNRGDRAFWQSKFWEHTIRDEHDYITHTEYIHYNPVKHGLVKAPKDWIYSSFHRYVRKGLYDEMWGSGERIVFDSGIGNE